MNKNELALLLVWDWDGDTSYVSNFYVCRNEAEAERLANLIDADTLSIEPYEGIEQIEKYIG